MKISGLLLLVYFLGSCLSVYGLPECLEVLVCVFIKTVLSTDVCSSTGRSVESIYEQVAQCSWQSKLSSLSTLCLKYDVRFKAES